MTRRQKLQQKVRRNPRNVSLADFEALVSDYGYIEEGGKHPKVLVGAHTMPYKRENPVKACYVKELLEIIDSLELGRRT